MTISAIWQQSWEKFKNANWVVGVVLVVLSAVVAFIPYIGTLLTYVLSISLSYYGLQVWRSDSPVDFGKVFPPLTAFLKILLGSILLAAIPLLIILISSYDSVMELLGILQTAQQASDDSEVELESSSFGKGLGPNLLMVGIGALVSIILNVLFYFYSYFILERNEGVLAAFQGSFSIFSQVPGKVILFILSQLFVIALGILVCGLGLLIAAPVSTIAAAGFYMSHRAEPSMPSLA